MPEAQTNRRLVYVKPVDLELWRCRPFSSIQVLDLQDRPVGQFDGIVIDAEADEPRFLVVRRVDAGMKSTWFLVPIGEARFDETARAIRIDVDLRRESLAFNPDELAKLSPDQAAEYERRVLAQCCPEVGRHSDGTPAYSRHASFKCPAWLKADASTRQ